MDDEEEEDVALKPGSVIESSKGNYVVMKLLGEGGFGAVYRVHDQKNIFQEYAMKVEKKVSGRRHSKLKMEIAILKMVARERSESHFTSIIDRGKKDTFYFLVMQLVGPSLGALKQTRPGKLFSIATGLGAGIQCLEACQDLHKFGFIHRDIKPANYACGLGEKRRVIYILDFGIARKILNSKGEIKAPRQTVRFKGTIRFASLACHKGIEMGPKDDCESWFYMLLDFIMPQGLIWKSMWDRNVVKYLKQEARTARRDQVFEGVKCKEHLMIIMDYLDTLQYQDRVDYDYIYKIIILGAQSAGEDLDKPYDWEAGDDPTQTQTGEERPRIIKLKKKPVRRLPRTRKAPSAASPSKARVVEEKKAPRVAQRKSTMGSVASVQSDVVDRKVPSRSDLVEKKPTRRVQVKGERGKARRGKTSDTASGTTSGLSGALDASREKRRQRRRKKKVQSSSSDSDSNRSEAGKDEKQSVNTRNMPS